MICTDLTQNLKHSKQILGFQSPKRAANIWYIYICISLEDMKLKTACAAYFVVVDVVVVDITDVSIP